MSLLEPKVPGLADRAELRWFMTTGAWILSF